MKRGERGIAAVTAILFVAVAATAAMMMLAQQSAMLDQTMLVASRAQADQYARAGLDWARGVILEDSRTSGAWDSLDEGWAQPIAGLPIERAVVAGALTDEQSKFNLNNLVDPGGKRSVPDAAIFQRLLVLLNLTPELADAVVDWIDTDSDLSGPAGAEDAYYLSLAKPYRAANQPMVQLEELYRVRGFDAAAVAKLKPYVTALPAPPGANGHTTININTASDLVLMAALPSVPKAKITQWVSARPGKPIKEASGIKALFPEASDADRALLDVKTSNFSVRIRVAQDDVELATDALLQRAPNGAAVVAWRRPRY
jgi:general secretion pathway protein K